MNCYFDNAATTYLSERALNTYIETAKSFPANPSSVHLGGLRAKAELERRRGEIATLLGVKPSNIIFTSGATESISLYFSSLLRGDSAEIITTRIEHDAVSSFMPLLKEKGWKITYLRSKNGLVDKEELREKLNPNVRAVAIMAVNNVTGAIEPISELAKAIREKEEELKRKIFFFSDSVQALGKTDLDLIKNDVDGASFSAHKVNGPRGVGLLYLKNPISFRPLSSAGGQESGRRGGTENLAGIAAFTEALKEWYEDREAESRIRAYNERLRAELPRLGLKILSPLGASPYILSLSSPLPSEVYTRILSDRGFAVSAGSACSNNAKGKSEQILEAMGVKHSEAANAIRISFDRNTEESAIELFIDTVRNING